MALALLSGLPACSDGSAQHEMPPPMVEVVTVQASAVPEVIDLPGRIRAIRSAEVRARIDGIVEQRLYREGAEVAAGAPLFRIDPRIMTAQVEEAQAALRRAEAGRVNAGQLVGRYGPLVSDDSVSATDFDGAQAAERRASADVGEARARLARARLQLDYAIVRAPIAGRVGIARVTEGALASASEATLLTSVDQLSTVQALFAPSRQTILALSGTGQGRTLPDGAGAVTLLREDGSEYPLHGTVDFSSPTIDPDTGSQLYRATFANPDGQLLPGQFVRVRFRFGTVRNGIVIPARAVQIGESNAIVHVLQKDGKLEFRPVELGRHSGQDWVISSGLKAGERIAVAGWQNARPGQPVRVKGSGAGAQGRAR